MKAYCVFDNKSLNNIYPFESLLLNSNGKVYHSIDDILTEYNILSQIYIFRRNTKVTDINDVSIYEYDFIEYIKNGLSYKGIVILRKGRFIVSRVVLRNKILSTEFEAPLTKLVEDKINIRVIGNSLKIKSCSNIIRNKFYFKVINTNNNSVIEDVYIDNNNNVYKIGDIRKRETYELLKDVKIVIATDCYDNKGELIYFKDNVIFNYDNKDYFGTVEYEHGEYTLVSNEFSIPLYSKFNDKKLSKIFIK